MLLLILSQVKTQTIGNCGDGCRQCSGTICTSCQSGYYLPIGNSPNCWKCVSNCLTCSGSAFNCLSCSSGYRLFGSACVRDVQNIEGAAGAGIGMIFCCCFCFITIVTGAVVLFAWLIEQSRKKQRNREDYFRMKNHQGSANNINSGMNQGYYQSHQVKPPMAFRPSPNNTPIYQPPPPLPISQPQFTAPSYIPPPPLTSPFQESLAPC